MLVGRGEPAPVQPCARAMPRHAAERESCCAGARCGPCCWPGRAAVQLPTPGTFPSPQASWLAPTAPETCGTRRSPSPQAPSWPSPPPLRSVSFRARQRRGSWVRPRRLWRQGRDCSGLGSGKVDGSHCPFCCCVGPGTGGAGVWGSASSRLSLTARQTSAPLCSLGRASRVSSCATSECPRAVRGRRGASPEGQAGDRDSCRGACQGATTGTTGTGTVALWDWRGQCTQRGGTKAVCRVGAGSWGCKACNRLWELSCASSPVVCCSPAAGPSRPGLRAAHLFVNRQRCPRHDARVCRAAQLAARGG